ncbi:MAG TPA: Fic family protein [Gemmatimonadales bacterium]|jgi:Fic family protein
MPGQTVSKIWASNPVIHAPARYKRACRYDAFIPDALGSLDLHLPVEIAGLVSDAEAAIRALNVAATAALAPLARLLLRTESIASSKVEGLQMNVRALARAEARMGNRGRKSETALEILDNIAAMETAISNAAATRRFGSKEIAAIHRRLMQHHPRPQIAGRVRTEQNWIGGNDHNPCGADFVPPPPEKLPALLRDLCDAVNGDLLPPLVQAALVHAQFETIHPFDDGNGRTGRALIHVILRRRGVAPAYVPPISVVLAARRDRYIDGLNSFRGDGVVEWIEHFAAAAARSAHLATRYVAAVEALMERWRKKLRKAGAPRADAAAWAIIDVLPAHPVITASVAISASGRSKGPVYDAMAQLEEAGVLIPLSQSPGSQSWEAAGLLDLVEGLEEGRAE